MGEGGRGREKYGAEVWSRWKFTYRIYPVQRWNSTDRRLSQGVSWVFVVLLLARLVWAFEDTGAPRHAPTCKVPSTPYRTCTCKIFSRSVGEVVESKAPSESRR